MQATNVYLNFDGNCREAMSFYGKCFGTTPGLTPFSAGPPEVAEAAKNAPDRILHSELHSGPLVLMASDVPPGMTYRQGNNFSISLSCESLEEMERLFAVLGENGKVTMPMHDAFWGGRFGMVTDQFGISWMLSYRAA
jgi:PhnB protein